MPEIYHGFIFAACFDDPENRKLFDGVLHQVDFDFLFCRSFSGMTPELYHRAFCNNSSKPNTLDKNIIVSVST